MSDPYRTPGKVDPPPGWVACPGCSGWLSPIHNVRRRADGKIVCMPCYEKGPVR